VVVRGIYDYSDAQIHVVWQICTAATAAEYAKEFCRYEKALGPEYTSILNTVSNLGALHTNYSKLEEAERIYTQALSAYQSIIRLGKPTPAAIQLCFSIR